MKYYLLTILFSMLALFTGICHAQSIYFNDKGQVFGNLPNKLETGSKLTFEVSGEDLGTAAQKQISERAKACKTRILAIQKDPDIMEQLKLVYQITPDDLKKVLTDMDAIDKASQSLTYIPAIDTSISHYQLYSKDISLTFDLKIHSNVPFEYNKPGWTLKYPNQNLLNLQLSRNELFKKSVYNWYAQTRVLFHTPDAGSLSDLKIASEKAKPVALAINAILQKRKNYLNSIDTLKRYNQQLDVLLEKLDKLPDISLLSENKNWVLKWLWHGGEGMPKLNPFDFISDTRYELPDTSGLPAKRMEVFTKENFLKSVDYTKVAAGTVENLVKQIAETRLEIGKQLKAYAKISGQTANNQKLIADFATTNTALNKLSLLASIPTGRNPILYMRHHDASDAGAILNTQEDPEYLESDRVFILTHNLIATEKAVITLKYATIATDQSPMAELLTGVLRQLDKVKADTYGGTADEKELLQVNTRFNQKLAKIKPKLLYLKAIEYILAQENPNLDIKEMQNKNEIYHTQRDRTPKMEGAVQATYTLGIADESKKEEADTTDATAIVKSSIPIDTFRYRVNKLYRIFPMAGIAYTVNDFASLNANATNTGPGIVENEKKTHFFAGLKVYLKKIDIRNTNFIGGKDSHGKNLFWSRTHLDVGFDLSDPLGNIFTGAGLDPWTGISVNFGAVWNRYTYNTYTSGIQSSSQKRYRPGFYIGISTDITLFAQIAKLLSLSK